MRRWYVVDDRMTARAAVFEEMLKATTKEDAIRDGKKAWGLLTAREQAEADSFGVCTMEQGEDGTPDYSTMDDWVDIKGAS